MTPFGRVMTRYMYAQMRGSDISEDEQFGLCLVSLVPCCATKRTLLARVISIDTGPANIVILIPCSSRIVSIFGISIATVQLREFEAVSPTGDGCHHCFLYVAAVIQHQVATNSSALMWASGDHSFLRRWLSNVLPTPC